MVKIYSPKILFAFFISLLFATSLFISCEKADDGKQIIGTYPDLTTQVRSSVSGFVTDENDQAVSLATVQVGAASITTDKYGYFEATNVDVVKNAAVVTVSKTGYFKGIKTYIAEDGKSAFFRIKLVRKTNAGTINGTAGGVVILSNGLSITLPANAVVNAGTNTAYSGTVNVVAHWLNPTAADLLNTMPGDLRGINTDGKLQLLTTYGMAAVELTGSGGESLQIATGKKATLSLPIPSSLSSAAPASIPLWYFDEAKGLWKEEGAATKTGNNYVGDVSHFSFWNVDLSENFIELSATLVTDRNNQPLQNARVKVSVVGNPANCRYGYTNSSGYVSGAVPANSQLLFEVFKNSNCSTSNVVVYSRNVTTTNVNISLGTIIVPFSNSNNLALITGTVVNCTNAPVTNGYVMVLSGNSYTRLNLTNTGTYSGIISLCSNTATPVTFIAEDLATNMTSGPVIFNIVPGNNTVPGIQVCSAGAQEYIHLIKNGVTQNYNYLAVSNYTTTSYGTSFFANPAMTVPGGHIQFTQAGIGLGSVQTLISSSIGSVNLVMNNPPVNVTITEFGAIGQYIAGNYSGSFTQPPSNTQYTITCNFRFKRYY